MSPKVQEEYLPALFIQSLSAKKWIAVWHSQPSINPESV
jgi:hypothetical protein